MIQCIIKERNSNKWKGQGKVISVDGQKILIKHGSTYVRCHPSHVILKDTTDLISLLLILVIPTVYTS